MDSPDSFLKSYPDTRHVDVLIPDINGILRGKKLPVEQLAKLYNGELMIPRATVLLDTFGGASENIPYGFQDGDPDTPVRAIANSLVPVPWSSTPSAQVLAEVSNAEVSNNGEPWFCNPAQVLRDCTKQFSQCGLTPVIAIELEFHLLTPDVSPPVPATPPTGVHGFHGPQTYNLELLADHAAFLEDLHHACQVQQISTGSALTEYGEGQFEVNLTHSTDILQACHDACLLRRLIRSVALKHGYIATFMAKPMPGNSGNGMHVHLSLLDASGNNVLAATQGELSQVMHWALGGLLQQMPDSMAIFAPNANAYQRFDADTFAPMQADWGHDHRAVALRLPRANANNTRIEHRIAGADACPYLVVAAILAATQLGIQQRLRAPTPTVGTQVSRDALALPHRWHAALVKFLAATQLHDVLGREFCQLYAQVKRDEEQAWHRQLNQFDYQLYLRTL